MATNNTEPKKDSPVGASDKPPVQSGPVTPKPPKAEVKKETVEISKDTLEKILSTIETLKDSDKAKTDTIAKLEAIADKGRLAHYEGKEAAARDGELITRAKVGFWEGDPIIAWQKVKDEVGFRNGQLVTNQVIRLFLDVPGEKEPVTKEMEYLYWAQNTTCQEGEVTSKNQTKEGTYWTVEMTDGRKISLDIRFINPF